MVERAGIGKKYRKQLAKAVSKSKGVLTPQSVSTALNTTQQEAARLLSRWNHGGWVKRIKRGVYVQVDPLSMHEHTVEDPWVIATQVFGKGYIGGFSAIKHWDLSEQIFETIYYFVIKQPKNNSPNFDGIRFHIKTIKKEKYFGTKSVWQSNTKIQVSDPSRTIIDFLDDPKLAGGMRVVQDLFDEYLNSEHRNLELLIKYADRLNNKTVIKRLGFLLDLTKHDDALLIRKLQKKISKGYSLFDPTMENKSSLAKWSLKLPQHWKDEYGRKK